jgi:hypothetical protein
LGHAKTGGIDAAMMLLVELVENLAVTLGERLSLVLVVHAHPPSELMPASTD